MTFRRAQLFLCLLPFFLVACGSSGTQTAPVFTSIPPTDAEETSTYSYTPVATYPDGNPSGAIYTLTSAPAGAAFLPNTSTVNWVPTHAQARVANNFSVTATAPSGGKATQSWTVTPNGVVNISAVATYWFPEGTSSVTPTWPLNLPYPAALVPQNGGTFLRLLGSPNADGSYGIPNVPAGNFWLEINPNAIFWTASSDFDYGNDAIGHPLATASQSTTTFNYTLSGLASAQAGDFVSIQSDMQNTSPLPFASLSTPGGTTFHLSQPQTSDIDWSKVSALYFLQYRQTSSGRFTGYTLGPAQTLSNASLTNGATNDLTAALSASPSVSFPLSVQGTAWASLSSSTGPGTPAPALSGYVLSAQPFASSDRLALPSSSVIGPQFSLLLPAAPDQFGNFNPPLYSCGANTGPQNSTFSSAGLPPITTDQNYGSISYGDPFPAAWLRLFQYCQISTISLPRPNSAAIDNFSAITTQTTALPTGPVTPILTPVQNPTVNGAILFQAATLNTTKIVLSWTAPATGTPFGYYVSVYRLNIGGGSPAYSFVARYGTNQTSITVPLIAAGATYVFTITANADAAAVIDKSPLRSKIPSAESGVVSATITTAPGSIFQ